MVDYSPFGSLAPQAPPDRDAMGSIYGAKDGLAQMQFPSWYQSSFGSLSPSPFPDAPPSRQDAAFQTSIDRWKQLAKDVFFAPADALKAFNEKPTFSNALGIMPMGTFGGPLAKTADRAALSTAEMLAGKGASREAIWNQTGWFQGPDKKWRFEIPDNSYRLNFTPELPNGVRVQANTVGQAVKHPELFSAYPSAADVRLTRGARPDSGFYDQSANRIGVGDTASHNMERSITLHELQHFIQQGPEGFAKGGSSKSIPPELIAQERQRINSIPEKGWSSVSPAGDATDAALASQVYHRLAGEVEARAVQNRMALTPEQRRARYPWLDYDVPIDQQIVK